MTSEWTYLQIDSEIVENLYRQKYIGLGLRNLKRHVTT
jgi:hypothetical protein